MTTLTAPIAKLYKRCARNHHDTCPGSFETWSVCSCDCHAGVSDERPAPTMSVSAPEKPVTCADKAEAVAEAVAIVSPTPAKKSPKAKASGLSTKTDKFAKWANAIVAKNSRIRLAWEEHQEKYGLYLTAGIAPSVRVTRCANGHVIEAKYNADYTQVIVSDGCHASGCEHANKETKAWDRKLAKNGAK